MMTPLNTLQPTAIISSLPFTDALAEHILHEQRSKLPDLSQLHIILPNAQAIRQMRFSLTKQSSQAFIGGFIGNLAQWLNQHTNSPGKTRKQITHATRQLLLLEALKQHPDLFASENHWQICDSLLELFDELSLSQHQWLDESSPVWIEHLQKAYQVDKPSAHLNHEATIIHTLWHAWQQQLQAMQIVDEAGALKQRLLEPISATTKDHIIYIVGLEQFSPLEQAWCEQLARVAQVQWITQNEIPGHENTSANTDKENNNNKLLQTIYSQQQPLYQRTRQYKDNHSHAFINKVKLFDAQSAEQETRAVDLKIRLSLLAGKSNIGVVTENRKLARRLRALLERADVKIQDTAGWALATTSAASILERWLECIEQDFAYQALLDLLKSPFFCTSENSSQHLNLVYRFEQDIILHENIANDLNRYKAAIKNRHDRLNLNNESIAEQLLNLLEHIQTAASKLTELFQNKQLTTPDNWIQRFISSIETLGIYQQFTTDIAGKRIQQELEKLSIAHNTATPDMSWQDFRTWLGSTLEREQFKPHDQTSAVKIMNLQQAQYCQFDCLIIAGANVQSFPGSPGQLPFFNQSVRQALQLKNWQQKKNYSLYQFQQMLLSAPDILITWQAEKNGEWMQPSPWVSSLQDFSQLAFNQSLRDLQLNFLLQQLQPITQRSELLIERIETVSQARPCIQADALPADYSASRHQRLIDCPYKFFASDILKLKPLEEITLELMKSEYGEKVHLILHAFHQQCPGLPAPFKGIITQQNKPQAVAHIKKLSTLVFENLIEDSIQHRGWLERWMPTAEAYIDWQIKRQQEWQIYQLEQPANHPLSAQINLQGRLDRVDKQMIDKQIADKKIVAEQHSNYSIIDYKTGETAHQQDIDSAENIQLTSYAALMDEVANVIYLKLDKGEIKQTGIVEGEKLTELKTDSLQRLQTIIDDIRSASPLPAWGDTQTCNYCDMAGLCRKQIWEVNSDLTDNKFPQ